jgi:hypothetical protein
MCLVHHLFRHLLRLPAGPDVLRATALTLNRWRQARVGEELMRQVRLLLNSYRTERFEKIKISATSIPLFDQTKSHRVSPRTADTHVGYLVE